MNNQTRRNALKKISGSTVGSSALLHSAKWVSPAILLQALPTHAQATQPKVCELDVMANYSMCLNTSVNKEGIVQFVYNGTVFIDDFSLTATNAPCPSSSDPSTVTSEITITFTGDGVNESETFTTENSLTPGESINVAQDINGQFDAQFVEDETQYSIIVTITHASDDPRFSQITPGEITGGASVSNTGATTIVSTTFDECAN